MSVSFHAHECSTLGRTSAVLWGKFFRLIEPKNSTFNSESFREQAPNAQRLTARRQSGVTTAVIGDWRKGIGVMRTNDEEMTNDEAVRADVPPAPEAPARQDGEPKTYFAVLTR